MHFFGKSEIDDLLLLLLAYWLRIKAKFVFRPVLEAMGTVVEIHLQKDYLRVLWTTIKRDFPRRRGPSLRLPTSSLHPMQCTLGGPRSKSVALVNINHEGSVV